MKSKTSLGRKGLIEATEENLWETAKNIN